MDINLKSIIYSLTLVCCMFLYTSVNAQQPSTDIPSTNVPDWEFINAGSIKFTVYPPYAVRFPKANEHGHLIGYKGFNITLGYSEITYFNPVRTKTFNPYWAWGTQLLIIPYFGWGSDYYFTKNIFLGWGFTYIVPFFHLGINF